MAGVFAGLYSEWSGVSLMIVVSISLLAGFTIWNGYRVDAATRNIEEPKELSTEGKRN
jgi:hypothetical protein